MATAALRSISQLSRGVSRLPTPNPAIEAIAPAAIATRKTTTTASQNNVMRPSVYWQSMEAAARRIIRRHWQGRAVLIQKRHNRDSAPDRSQRNGDVGGYVREGDNRLATL